MSVQRYDLNKCIGCRNCVEICPMDVFRFNEDRNRSVIAYPENCQSCGQCFVYCLGHSLAMSGEAFAYPLTSVRAASVLPMNRQLLVSGNPRSRIVMPAIAGVLGAMFAHNAVVWNRKAAEIRAAQGETVTRMSATQRWQHLIMLLSFLCLVFSGFGMRYFGVWLENSIGVGRHFLGIVHRAAGVALVASALCHLYYVVFTREGRRLLHDMLTKPKGASGMWGALRYYLGFSKERPKFGRYTYAEKMEYWFLVVGTVSMTITGIMMWFYLRFNRIFSDWWVSFAKAWHIWEAVLASLAIVIWHFYQVFADPDVSPMNSAWLNGKMPADLYRREHELDPEFAPRPSIGAGPVIEQEAHSE